jgi:hypothetical protein
MAARVAVQRRMILATGPLAAPQQTPHKAVAAAAPVLVARATLALPPVERVALVALAIQAALAVLAALHWEALAVLEQTVRAVAAAAALLEVLRGLAAPAALALNTQSPQAAPLVLVAAGAVAAAQTLA